MMAMRTTPLLNISINELSPISALADIELFERISAETYHPAYPEWMASFNCS